MDATKSNGVHVSGQPGVTWNTKVHRWHVQMFRGGKNFSLGFFREEDLPQAIALRQQAANAPDDEIPALKARFGIRRRGAKVAAPPLPADPEDGLIALYRAACEADEDLLVANRECERATNQAHRAEERSVEAWNAFAEALAAQGRNIDSGFIRSKLGALLEEQP